MADLEKRVENLENKFPTLEQQVNSTLTKLDMFIAEMRAAREKQDEDMREMRSKQAEDRTKHDDDMRAIRQSIEDMGKHNRNLTIAVIIGIAAMVIAVLSKQLIRLIKLSRQFSGQ